MPILLEARDELTDITFRLRNFILPRKGGGGHGGHSSSSSHGSSGDDDGGDDGGSSSSGSSPESEPESSSSSHSSSSSSSKDPAAAAVAKSGVSASSGRPVTRPIGFGSSSGLSSDVEASPYGAGSSVEYTLGSTSPFSGRTAGGGDRATVFGTQRYGSGYPYGGYGYYTTGRPFPYAFWPIYWGPHYYGDDEYNNYSEDRPGGTLVSATIQPNGTFSDTSNGTTQLTYRLIGDNASVIAVLDALATNCSVLNVTTTLYNPSNTSSPQPEEVIQYYRASSFALTLDIYNNSAASYANMPASNDSTTNVTVSDTPLPSNINTTFLACLNETIGASTPLLNAPPSSSSLSKGAIAGITVGSVVGLLLLLCMLTHAMKRRTRRRREEIRRDLDQAKKLREWEGVRYSHVPGGQSGSEIEEVKEYDG